MLARFSQYENHNGSPITFSGFNSIDFDSILNAIMTAERVDVAALETQRTALDTQGTALITLAGKLEALQSALDALRDQSGLFPLAAASSDPDAVGVPTTSGGVAGLYQLRLVEQYRAGLDAELMLLHRLQALAIEQRRAIQTASMTDIHATVDDRDRVFATLVTVEHELKGVRLQLGACSQWLAQIPAFQEIVDRHKEAADLVSDIILVDRDSLEALNEAEQARLTA